MTELKFQTQLAYTGLGINTTGLRETYKINWGGKQLRGTERPIPCKDSVCAASARKREWRVLYLWTWLGEVSFQSFWGIQSRAGFGANCEVICSDDLVGFSLHSHSPGSQVPLASQGLPLSRCTLDSPPFPDAFRPRPSGQDFRTWGQRTFKNNEIT